MKVTMLMLVLFTIYSCSIVRYEGKPDGTTVVNAYVLGTDKALSGFNASIDKNGKRSLKVDSYDSIQTKGLEQINQGLKLIMQGLAEGAVSGVAP